MPLQIRRGPTADRTSITPVVGELIFDETEKRLYVGDGTTAGGVSAASFSTEDAQDATAQLFTHADHTGISFTYNDSQGKITAIADVPDLSNYLGVIKADGFKGSFFTDDSTTLIDGVLGSVNLDGTVRGHIVPQGDELYDLGSVSNKFRDLYLSGSTIQLGDATISATGSAVNLPEGTTIGGSEIINVVDGSNYNINIVADDSTPFVTSNDRGINANTVNANGFFGPLTGSVLGDLQGSVFGDDSTIIIDGLENQVVGPVVSAFGIRTITEDQGVFEATAITEGNPGATVLIQSSRGTLNNPTIIEQGDSCVDFQGAGYDGTQYTIGSYIKLAVDNNVSVSDSIVPGRVVLGTFDASGNTGLSNVAIWSHTGRLGLSVLEPTEKLDVDGNGKFSGSVSASSFVGDITGSLYADTSTVVFDGTDSRLFVENINVIGETGNSPADTGTVDSWLEIVVNGNTRYLPLYA